MSTATLRCYAELNDFLPVHRRQHDIRVDLRGAPAPVRHLMESQGIPHTEVELILVNGRSVGLDYPVRDGDRVSVYPVFEALDISPELRIRPRPLREPRFLADAHLGRLARLLRLLGFDTLFDNDPGDDVLARMAGEQGRILLTRDRALLMRRCVTHGCYIRSGPPLRQLAELVRRLDLYRLLRPFARCTRCNRLLVRVDKRTVIQRLPARVAAAFDVFWRCEQCGRVYWQGSHYRRLSERVRMIEAEGAGRLDSQAEATSETKRVL